LITPNTAGVEWALRIAVFGEFLGHGVLALQHKASFVALIESFTGFEAAICAEILFVIGIIDLMVAFIVLFKPLRIVLAYAVFWGFVTALARPLYAGAGILAFVERFTNWGAPLALLLLRGKTTRSSERLH